MKLSDVGWVWEGHGLDPGVYPSIFGVGEGADFFGLRKVRFLFHPTNDLVLQKLSDKEEVVCDISKWGFRDVEHGGSACTKLGGLETVLSEAEKISAYSQTYPNVTGAYYDDMKGLMEKEGHGADECARIHAAVKRHNPNLRLECVVYCHELDEREFWRPLIPYIDVVVLWVWGYQHIASLPDDILRCRELFPDIPILMGCYLRDYPSKAPMPMDAIRRQWDILVKGLSGGLLAGYDVLGTVLIDGQLEQAEWIRDFIRDHS